MPQPTLGDVHVNALMTNLSLMYMQDQDAFVALKVFPIIPVSFISNLYAIYTRADFNRNTMKKRAPATESVGTGYTISTGTYIANVWSLHKDLSDQIVANTDSIFNPNQEATKFLTNQALISREIDWATTYMNAGAWNGGMTGVASGPSSVQFLQWNDSGSTPIQDLRRLKRNMQLASGGYRPNKLVLTRDVWDTIIDHPDFVDRIKYGGTNRAPAQIARESAAALFEVDELLVMDAVYNTGAEGQTAALSAANESNAFIASKGALLLYTPPEPGLQIPAAGYTFAWTGYFGATGQGTRIKSFRMEHIESTRVEIDQAYAHVAVGKDMGGYIASAIA